MRIMDKLIDHMRVLSTAREGGFGTFDQAFGPIAKEIDGMVTKAWNAKHGATQQVIFQFHLSSPEILAFEIKVRPNDEKAWKWTLDLRYRQTPDNRMLCMVAGDAPVPGMRAIGDVVADWLQSPVEEESHA
jgi:hypothetical protein